MEVIETAGPMNAVVGGAHEKSILCLLEAAYRPHTP